MTRFEKKCLIASTGMHLFLLLLLVFGSAFFVSKERPPTNPRVKIYPSRIVEAALAGGGGNPRITPSDDVQKGVPNPAAPVLTTPPAKPQTRPAPPEAKVEKVDKTPPKHKIDLTELQPVMRTDKEKEKARQEAEQQAARDRARAEARRIDRIRQQLAQKLNRTAEEVGRGFASGTKVDVGGLGGEAYASYGALVQAAYADAWQILPDLSDDDFITQVRVTISRDGRVISSEIVRKSGSALMDKSVQKALDRVKAEGLPRFPDFIKDSERSFNIEFNLKTRKLLG